MAGATGKQEQVLSPEETARLVKQALKGESQAFEALAQAFLRPAYSTALSVVGRPADAEDVAQDALVRALQRLETCRKPKAFGAWLRRIVKNESKNWVRRRGLRDVGGAGDVSGESGAVRHGGGGRAAQRGDEHRVGIRDELVQALNTLSPIQREVLLLHDLEGCTHPEVASLLSLSVLMSRQHLFKARKKLREVLRRDDVDNPGHQKKEAVPRSLG